MIRNKKVLAVFTTFLLSRYVHTTTTTKQNKKKKKEQKDNKKHINKVKTQHLTNIYDYVNKKALAEQIYLALITRYRARL